MRSNELGPVDEFPAKEGDESNNKHGVVDEKALSVEIGDAAVCNSPAPEGAVAVREDNEDHPG